MNKLTAVLAALLVVALAAPGHAGIDEGDWDVGLSIDWFIGDLQNNFGGEVSLGYFVTPEIEVGGWVGYHYRDISGDIRDHGKKTGDIDLRETWFDVAAFGAYHFVTDGEWMPYVGGFVGYEDGEIDAGGDDDYIRDGFFLGAMVGIKYFVGQKATIFLEYRLVWRTEDEWKQDHDSDVTIDDDQISHLLLIGISLLF